MFVWGNYAPGSTDPLPFEIPDYADVDEVCAAGNRVSFFLDSGEAHYAGNASLLFGISVPTIATDFDGVVNFGSIVSIRNLLINEFTGVAITFNGELFTWGKNNSGILGRNGTDYIPSTVSVPLNGTFILDISIGSDFILVSDSLQNVYSWGNNDNSQLGRECSPSSPCEIPNIVNVPILHKQTGKIRLFF